MPGKRGNGEGSIYKATDGRWVGAVTLASGKRRVAYGKTRQEAAGKLADLLKLQRDGLNVQPNRETVAHFFTGWLETIKPRLQPGSYVTYEASLRRQVIPLLGAHRLDRLRPQHIQSFYAQLLEGGLSANTVNRIHNSVIFPPLEQALRWNLIPRNVAGLVDLPKIEKVEAQVFSMEQARVFLSAIQGDPIEALYVVAITTGMRQGELLGLRWSNVDLDGRMIQVSEAYKRDYKGRKIGRPKSETSRRKIALSLLAVEALVRHRAQKQKARDAAGRPWTDQDFVFPSGTGRPINPSWLRQDLFYPLLARAGLPRITFHALRHTFATLQIAQGTNLKIISEMLGHASIRITADQYGHISDTMQRQAQDGLDRLLRSRPENHGAAGLSQFPENPAETR